MSSRSLFLVLVVMAVTSFISCETKENPKAVELYLKGKEFFLNKNLDKAESHFKDALTVDSDFVNAQLMLGKVYFYKNKMQDAQGCMNAILKNKPDHVGALYWHSKILLFTCTDQNRKENESNAEKELLKILEIDSSHTPARALLALLYEKKEKFKEAINQYQMIFDVEKDIVDAHANLGIMYRKMGMKEQSVEQLNVALERAKALSMDQSSLKKIKGLVEK